MSKRQKISRIMAVFAALALFTAGSAAQELSTFLAHLPAPGAWARYRIETDRGTYVKKEPFDLLVTGGEKIHGVPYVWLEAGPTNFAGYRDGYLRLLMKADPGKDEAMNPFLAALALAYQEPGGEPFRLSRGALGFMHSQAKDIKITQNVEHLPPAKAETIKGKVFDCSRVRMVTTTETSFFTQKYKVVETGTYWLSPDTPFRIVKADIERVETKNGKESTKKVKVTLKIASYTGAKTHFTKPAVKSKGLLGLLFH
jgi:hypothetical protein